MYFPRGFDHRKALQLADLVGQAYTQLDAFKAGRPWALRGGYTLVAELRYPWRRPPGARSASSLSAVSGAPASRAPRTEFDRELQELVRSRTQREVGLPIGFIARAGSETFLAFRGTMTAGEWLRDLKVRLVAYPHGPLGSVHAGFSATYDLLRTAVIDSLAPLPGGKLFVAGHSLGAALATLAVPDIVLHTRFKTPTCYTYGSPRVGDRRFAAEFDRMMAGRSFRIANSSDLIVSMPLPVPFLGFFGGYFTHVDTPVDFTAQNDSNERNHDLKTYLSALRQQRPRGPFALLWRPVRTEHEAPADKPDAP